jgi:hypothetical protein
MARYHTNSLYDNLGFFTPGSSHSFNQIRKPETSLSSANSDNGSRPVQSMAFMEMPYFVQRRREYQRPTCVDQELYWFWHTNCSGR